MSQAPQDRPSDTRKTAVSWGRHARFAVWLLLASSCASLPAQGFAQETWVPPAPFPEERYESGWRKNPFTLKTAPVAIQRESFAKNLALGSMYDDADGITSVVVVNTKTRERTRLKGGDPSPNGMRVWESVIADTRRDSYAVVVMGGEKATLRYDETFLKQMAAGGGGGTGVAGSTAANQKGGAHGGAEGQPANQPTEMSGAQGTGAPVSPSPTSTMAANGSPTPPPPNIRPPAGTGQAGRPTIMSRRRLTAPGGMPQPAPPPLAPTDNP